VWAQTESLPDAVDGVLRNAKRCGQRAGTPHGVVCRPGSPRLANEPRDRLIADRPRPTGAQLVVQNRQSLAQKASARATDWSPSSVRAAQLWPGKLMPAALSKMTQARITKPCEVCERQNGAESHNLLRAQGHWRQNISYGNKTMFIIQEGVQGFIDGDADGRGASGTCCTRSSYSMYCCRVSLSPPIDERPLTKTVGVLPTFTA